MPFEFTGTPPALVKDTPGTFGSFSQQSAPQALPASETSSQTSLKSPSAFASLRSSFSSPSFQYGAPILTTPGSSQAKFNRPPVGAPRHNDTVSRALLRASEKRPAIFGHAELGADAILNAYMQIDEVKQLYNGADEAISQLSTEYAAVTDGYPGVAKLLQFALSRAALASPDLPSAPATIESQIPDLILGIEPNSALHDALMDALCDVVLEKVFDLNIAGDDRAKVIETILVTLVSDTTIKALEVALIENHSPEGCDEAELKKLAAWVGEKVRGLRKELNTSDMTRLFLPNSQYEEKQAKELATSNCNSDWYGIRHDTRKAKNEKPCCDRPEVVRPQPSEGEVTEEPSTPFRLMDLPAELRTWVYRATLCPTGAISLRSCDHHLPFGAAPTLGVRLLATCKQVHDEAKDLLFQNTVIANAMVEGGTTRTALHRSQLPDHSILRITSLVIVMDCATRHPEQRMDWRPLEKMTSLMSLRICAFESQDNKFSIERWSLLLKAMFATLPQICSIRFGSQAGTAERDHFDDMMERKNKYIAERPSAFYGAAVEVSKEALEQAHSLTFAGGSTGRKMQ